MPKNITTPEQETPFTTLFMAVNQRLLDKNPQIKRIVKKECEAMERALSGSKHDAKRELPKTYVGARPQTHLEKLLSASLYNALGVIYAFRRPTGGDSVDILSILDADKITTDKTQAALHHCWKKVLEHEGSDLKRVVSGTGRDLWMALALYGGGQDNLQFDGVVVDQLLLLDCPPSLRQDLDGDTVWSYVTQYNATKHSKVDFIDALGHFAMAEKWNVADFGPMELKRSVSELKTEHRARVQHWTLALELQDQVLSDDHRARQGRLIKM